MRLQYDSPFRSIYESSAVLPWAVSAACCWSMPYGWAPALISGAMGVYRGNQTWKLLQLRLKMSSKWLSLMPINQLLQERTAMSKHAKQEVLHFGEGFRWGPQHAQLASELLDMHIGDEPKKPWWIPQKLVDRATPKNSILDVKPAGVPWIHGMEPDKVLIDLALTSTEGHTLIGGTTGAGKTRAYEILTSQIIHMNKGLIIIDPKNDLELRVRVERECKAAGRKYLYFSQSRPSVSIRLNPLENWSQSSEIASRVSQLIEEGAFRDFSFMFLDQIVGGQLFIGDKPTLNSLMHYAQSGVNTLLDKCLHHYYVRHNYLQYESEAATYMGHAKTSKLEASVLLYKNKFQQGEHTSRVIDGLISIFEHEREHFSKIIANLLSLLQKLTGGELGNLLSPDASDINDTREIWDIKKVIEQGAVLYMGLDSMSNNIVSAAIGSMALADIAAVLGSIYNFSAGRKEIFLFVDEAYEAMNEQGIQILNKGRGAGARVFIAMQTLADMEARFGSRARMQQVLANCNNQIIFRLEDLDTADWFSKKCDETSIQSVERGVSHGTESEAHAFEFRSSTTAKIKSTKGRLVPVACITRLPNLQCFIREGGGLIKQARIPILQD